MDIQAILGVPQTAEAMYMQAQYLRVRDFLAGRHKVLQRKDFTFKDETFETAKIILQSVPAVVDFHASYICGNPVTLTGESAAVGVKLTENHLYLVQADGAGIQATADTTVMVRGGYSVG